MRRKVIAAAMLLALLFARAAAQDAVHAEIHLLGDRAQITGTGAQAEGTTIQITQGGTYRVSGTLDEGSILVYAGKTAEVTLILDGVSIFSADATAIQSEKTGLLTLELAADSVNTLQTGVQEENSPDSDIQETQDSDETTEAEDSEDYVHCVKAKGDLAVTGDGALTVRGYLGNGLHASGHVDIHSGSITVESAKDAIRGKESVEVFGGEILLISQDDGIQSENGDGEGTGYVAIHGGTVHIESAHDAVQSETTLTILGGEIEAVCAGGAGESNTQSGDFVPMMGQMGTPPELPQGDMGQMGMPPEPPQGDMGQMGTPPELPQGDMGQMGMPPELPKGDMEQNGESGNTEQDAVTSGQMQERGGRRSRRGMMMQSMDGEYGETQSEDTPSTKGLKCGTDLIISGGTTCIDALDDALHAGRNILISGGEMMLSSGDDGIHADGDVQISAGSVTVKQSVEALEGQDVLISGGEISLTASDDGVNAGSGFGMMRGQSQTQKDMEWPILHITGGTVTVDAQGDGLDSNGHLAIDGGYVIVSGPSRGGNGALDSGAESGGTCSVNGGTVLALDSGDMTEYFDEGSQQAALMLKTDQALSAGDTLQIFDNEGNLLMEHLLTKSASCVIFSSPELSVGDVVTVVTAQQSTEVTVGEYTAEERQSGFGGMGGRRGGRVPHLAPDAAM